MPGFQYYYYPFKSRNDITLNVVTQKYQEKQNVQVVTGEMLPNLNPSGTLLIDGHSGDGEFTITARSGEKTFEIITVKDLKTRLAVIPTNFVAIRMLACFGATFARVLAKQLGETHPGIHVGGYSQSVFHVPGSRAATKPGGPNTTGSGLVWWYDAKGARVQKPARQKWALDDENAPWPLKE